MSWENAGSVASSDDRNDRHGEAAEMRDEVIHRQGADGGDCHAQVNRGAIHCRAAVLP